MREGLLPPMSRPVGMKLATSWEMDFLFVEAGLPPLSAVNVLPAPFIGPRQLDTDLSTKRLWIHPMAPSDPDGPFLMEVARHLLKTVG